MTNNGFYITVKALYTACDNYKDDTWKFIIYSTINLYRDKTKSLAIFEGSYDDLPANLRNAEIEAFQISQEDKLIHVYTTNY